MSSKHHDWDLVIESEQSVFHLNFKEVWRYKDLILLFVKRDIITVYKQTVLGPVWFFVQPILTSIVFILIFGEMAGLSTDGLPMSLFYLSGIILWNYFSSCVTAISNTFVTNAAVFGKVYFPRLVNPIAVVISNFVKLSIQLIPFLVLWIYYVVKGEIEPNLYMLWLPLIVIYIACMGLGLGLFISAITTKYRDFSFLVSFGLQLLMYASSVIYPLSKASNNKIFLQLNPMTWLIEIFRYGWLGQGYVSIYGIAYVTVFSILALLAGLVAFNKVERFFMDTV